MQIREGPSQSVCTQLAVHAHVHSGVCTSTTGRVLTLEDMLKLGQNTTREDRNAKIAPKLPRNSKKSSEKKCPLRIGKVHAKVPESECLQVHTLSHTHTHKKKRI